MNILKLGLIYRAFPSGKAQSWTWPIKFDGVIPRVAMHLTDKLTQGAFGVSVVYVLAQGVDYLFFYLTDELAVIFFISTPLEVQVDTAFRAPH
jgi:hypothetical protein